MHEFPYACLPQYVSLTENLRSKPIWTHVPFPPDLRIDPKTSERTPHWTPGLMDPLVHHMNSRTPLVQIHQALIGTELKLEGTSFVELLEARVTKNSAGPSLHGECCAIDS